MNYSKRISELRAVTTATRIAGRMFLNVKPYDIVVGNLIMEEVGGTLTDIEGRPVANDVKRVAASNGTLHNRLLKVLAETV